jgi:tetratricopeptide (TPR) repeat protein
LGYTSPFAIDSESFLKVAIITTVLGYGTMNQPPQNQESSLERAIKRYKNKLLAFHPSPSVRIKGLIKSAKRDIKKNNRLNAEVAAVTTLVAIITAIAVVLILRGDWENQRTVLVIAVCVFFALIISSFWFNHSAYLIRLLKQVGLTSLANRVKKLREAKGKRQKHLPRRIKEILDTRDDIEHQIDLEQSEKRPVPSTLLNEISELDQKLKKYSVQLAKSRHLEAWREICKKQSAGWWWACQPPIHILDRFDWLWKFLTVCFIIASLSFAVDLATRFWKGGADIWGALAVIGPSLLTFLLGKESLDQAIQSRKSIDDTLRNMKFPQPLRQEAICLLAFCVLSFTILAHGKRVEMARCFYENGESFLPEAQKLTLEEVDRGFCPFFLGQFDLVGRNIVCGISKTLNIDLPKALKIDSPIKDTSKSSEDLVSNTTAEIEFQRATSLDPDHANAHFQLGYRHEIKRDIEKARDEYKTAIQNGSLIASVRLANLYILEQKTESINSAILILSNKWEDVNKFVTEFDLISIFIDEQERQRNPSPVKEGKIVEPPFTKEDEKKVLAIVKREYKDKKDVDEKDVKSYYISIVRGKKIGQVTSYYTALGWARFKQKRYSDAEKYLDIAEKLLDTMLDNRQGEEIDSVGISAYCIKASFLDIQKKRDEASERWEKCRQYASWLDPDEDVWLDQARKRVGY